MAWHPKSLLATWQGEEFVFDIGLWPYDVAFRVDQALRAERQRPRPPFMSREPRVLGDLDPAAMRLSVRRPRRHTGTVELVGDLTAGPIGTRVHGRVRGDRQTRILVLVSPFGFALFSALILPLWLSQTPASTHVVVHVFLALCLVNYLVALVILAQQIHRDIERSRAWLETLLATAVSRAA
jgi:hypothetical protein